jgi:haloalkane dehalogenase
VNVLRTPDARFEALPDFAYIPHYAEIGGGLRAHYVDDGPAHAAPVLLMHGEPSWSFLYRKMIPVLVAAGHRCVAPDLIGFGRSDKPAAREDYTYQRHVDWMRELLFDRLDLRDITFFGQDWGGLIGLRLVAAEPDRFARVVVGNTGLPTGDRPPNEAFLSWQRFSQESPSFPIGGIVAGGCATKLDDAVIAASAAPSPDDPSRGGPRFSPPQGPRRADDPAHAANVEAWTVLRRFNKPFLCAFSDSDPVTKGGERVFLSQVPGANGQPHTTIEGGGHFLQEDKGPELARVIADFIERT